MKNYLVHYRTAERDSVSLRVKQNWIDNKSTQRVKFQKRKPKIRMVY